MILISQLPESFRPIFEIITLIFQLFFVVLLFVLIPILWYILVNNLNFSQIREQIQLRLKGLNMAILWGVIATIIMFAILFILGIGVVITSNEIEEVSNIPELEMIFSPPIMFILIIIQPVGEEIFFRGFLLDKVNSLYGKNYAMISTAILFGIAHLLPGKFFPAIMTGIFGFILAYLVLKTKNLYAAIIAHILFNIISFSFYYLSQYINLESLIL